MPPAETSFTAPLEADGGLLVDAHVVALAFGGWSHPRLRVWRHRHPNLLPVTARGPHGVAVFRWIDVQHAVAVIERDRHLT